MHTQSRLNGELALDLSASFETIGRPPRSSATSPRAVAGRRAERTANAPLRDAIDAYALHALASNGFGDANVGGSGQRVRSAYGPLDQRAHTHRFDRLAQIVEAKLRTVGAVARRMYANWKQRRQIRETYVALCELDTRTLRDLGFDRSEILSVAAEIAGSADATRTRSIQARRGLHV